MKKFVKVSVLSLALIAFTGTAALANYGKDNKVSGYVKEKGTLKPIKGAKVKVYTLSGTKKGSDTTSLKGKYTIKKLTERKYKVRATATGFHDPKNIKKNTVSSTVKIDGSKHKNFYFAVN